MRRRRNKGFMFILAMLAIAMVGAAIFVLASSSRALLFDANRALLEARTRNLTASGLAWAAHNRDRLSETRGRPPIELDVADLEIPHAALSVSVEGGEAEARRIRIRTASPRGRSVANRRTDYPAPLER